MTPSTATWVLVADARSARIFSFHDRSTPWTLHETIQGDGSSHPDQTAGGGSKASLHKGALHAHGEFNAKETQERRFAHTLVHVLERGLVSKAFAHLMMAAPPKLLGDLRENLSRGLQATVFEEHPKDYTHSNLTDLMSLLRPA